MKPNDATFSVRASRDLFQKFYYVAEYEGRSANGEIIELIKKAVKEYEAEHGEIILEEDGQNT